MAFNRMRIFLAMAAAALCAPQVSATEFCNIKKTRDGFVALRAGASPDSKLVARMRHGDEVLADGGVEMRNGWMYVTWWKGGRFKVKRAVGYDPPNGKGWMNSKLIEDECG